MPKASPADKEMVKMGPVDLGPVRPAGRAVRSTARRCLLATPDRTWLKSLHDQSLAASRFSEVGEAKLERWTDQYGQQRIGLLMGSPMPDRKHHLHRSRAR